MRGIGSAARALGGAKEWRRGGDEQGTAVTVTRMVRQQRWGQSRGVGGVKDDGGKSVEGGRRG